MLKNEFERDSVCIKLVTSWICKVREMRSEELRFLGFFVRFLFELWSGCGCYEGRRELRKEQSWGKLFWLGKVFLVIFVCVCLTG